MRVALGKSERFVIESTEPGAGGAISHGEPCVSGWKTGTEESDRLLERDGILYASSANSHGGSLARQLERILSGKVVVSVCEVTFNRRGTERHSGSEKMG